MKKSTWYFTKKKDKLELDSKELFAEWVKHIKEDERGLMTISNIPRPKSTKQNRAYWGMIIERIVREFEDLGIDSSYIYNLPIPTGTPITKEQLHHYFYAIFPQFNEKGEVITMSHKDWSMKHSHDLFENIRNFMASQYGIVIEDPDPEWRLHNV